MATAHGSGWARRTPREFYRCFYSSAVQNRKHKHVLFHVVVPQASCTPAQNPPLDPKGLISNKVSCLAALLVIDSVVKASGPPCQHHHDSDVKITHTKGNQIIISDTHWFVIAGMGRCNSSSMPVATNHLCQSHKIQTSSTPPCTLPVRLVFFS